MPFGVLIRDGWLFLLYKCFSALLENNRRIIADGARRSRLENALEPLIESSFELLVSPLIPCLQPLLIDTM